MKPGWSPVTGRRPQSGNAGVESRWQKWAIGEARSSRYLDMVEVAGSNPAWPTRFMPDCWNGIESALHAEIGGSIPSSGTGLFNLLPGIRCWYPFPVSETGGRWFDSSPGSLKDKLYGRIKRRFERKSSTQVWDWLLLDVKIQRSQGDVPQSL